MASQDFYSILGISREARPEQIKEAYHSLARKHHPDRQISEEVQAIDDVDFVAITVAYNTLKDQGKREKYDEEMKKRSGQPAKAQGEDERAQQTRDEIGKNAYVRGVAEMKQGRFQSAKDLFYTAVKHDSTQPDYYSMLGLATIESGGGFSVAEMNCEKAIALAPWNPQYHVNLGKVYLKANIKSQAKKKLEEALRWDPNHKEANLLMASLEKKSSLWQRLKGK